MWAPVLKFSNADGILSLHIIFIGNKSLQNCEKKSISYMTIFMIQCISLFVSLSCRSPTNYSYKSCFLCALKNKKHSLIPSKLNVFKCVGMFKTFRLKCVEILSWWRHQMETFSALLVICAGNSPVPTQRPVTRSFDVFFDLRLNKRLSKQSWGWWFETPSRPLWRHCIANLVLRLKVLR